MPDEKALVAATKVGIGAAAGVASAVKNAAAPQFQKHVGMGAFNSSSSFFNGFTKALKNHKGAAGAISAGTAAVIGHGVAATTVVAAAPVIVMTAAAGGALFGAYKLFEFVKDKLDDV